MIKTVNQLVIGCLNIGEKSIGVRATDKYQFFLQIIYSERKVDALKIWLGYVGGSVES